MQGSKQCIHDRQAKQRVKHWPFVDGVVEGAMKRNSRITSEEGGNASMAVVCQAMDAVSHKYSCKVASSASMIDRQNRG
jgi:hypothetical protein